MPDVTITSTPLPNVLFEGDMQETLDLFADHLVGDITGEVLTGQTGGTSPTSDVGLWVNDSVLYDWDDDEGVYLPVPVVIGRVFTSGSIVLTAFRSLATVNRSLDTPDKDGVIALTDDVYNGTETKTLGGTSATINYSELANNYYITLSGNTTISHTGNEDGMTRNLWVEQPVGQSYTVTHPGVIWDGASAPVQTANPVNCRAIDHYQFWTIGAVLFGKRLSADHRLSTTGGAGEDVIAPSFASATRANSTGTVTITMSEILQAVTLTTTDFELKKATVSQTVTSATISGNKIIVDTGTTFTAAQAVTIKYTNNSNKVKDVAGNAAATFGPMTVASNAGGGGQILPPGYDEP